jgi:DNA-directed RNA polymerase specialized sigma24 family protein
VGLAERGPAARAAALDPRLDGLKCHEIAEVLGVPIGTIKPRLRLAIARMRQMAQAAHLGRTG